MTDPVEHALRRDLERGQVARELQCRDRVVVGFRRTSAAAIRAVGLVAVVERRERQLDAAGDDVLGSSVVTFTEWVAVPPFAPAVVLGRVGVAVLAGPGLQRLPATLVLAP